VLQAVGATAVGGVGLVGTASATDEADGPPVFCGCSQVCACSSGRADVLVAVEEDDGVSLRWVENAEFNFCVSIDDPGVPDGKIIAVQVGGTRWINPNNCAEKALEAEQRQLDSTHPRPAGRAARAGSPPVNTPVGRTAGSAVAGAAITARRERG